MLSKDAKLIDHRIYAIEPVFFDDYKTRLITSHGVYLSELSAFQLFKEVCLHFGSTMDGRLKAVREVLGYRQKTPLVLIPDLVAAFPTESYSNLESVHIFNHPFKLEVIEKKETKLTFEDGVSIIVNVSRATILKQKQKCQCTVDTFRTTHEKMKNYIKYDSIRKEL